MGHATTCQLLGLEVKGSRGGSGPTGAKLQGTLHRDQAGGDGEVGKGETEGVAKLKVGHGPRPKH